MPTLAMLGVLATFLAPGVVIERVAAVVDGYPIFASEVEKRPLDELIDEALVLREGRRMSLTWSDEDVDRAIEEIKKANAIDDAALAVALEEQGYTLAGYRAEVGRQILILRTRNLLTSAQLHGVDDPDQRTARAEELMTAWIAERRAHAHIEMRDER